MTVTITPGVRDRSPQETLHTHRTRRNGPKLDKHEWVSDVTILARPAPSAGARLPNLDG
jgi:hypothetical protein